MNPALKAKVFLLLILISIARVTAQDRESSLLKRYSDSLRYSKSDSVRAAANDSFRLLLEDLLRDDRPFDLNLDSVRNTVSVLNSDDGKLRVISWIYVNDREEFSNHCVVLYRKRQGAHEYVYWLKAAKGAGKDSLYEEYGQDQWPGALYYQLHHFRKKRKDYYCVLGLDGHNSYYNRKIIDVLWVDKEGELHIGAPVFYASEADFTPQYRVYFEYADQATMLLRFEKELKMITFSNLVPSQPIHQGKRQYYIPDGRIDYYKLTRKGKWIRYEGLTEFGFEGNM